VLTIKTWLVEQSANISGTAVRTWIYFWGHKPIF